MIKITFYQKNENFIGFVSSGHADYDDYGLDIVCSAVSALTINAANSIEALTQDTFKVFDGDKPGLLEVIMYEHYSKESVLLLQSLYLGLKSISDAYGEPYIKINIEEV